MADVARASGAHFHVDAAWGGPCLLSQSHRAKLRGIERADTVTIDGHKQLHLPLGVGLLLFNDPRRADDVVQEASYACRAGSWDRGRHGVEGSRPAAALFLHAAMHVVGRRGYERLIDASVERARYMADAIRASDELELLVEPELNVVVYRYVPPELRGSGDADRDEAAIDALNAEIHRRQVEGGRSYVSRTTLTVPRGGATRAIVCLRAVIGNPLTRARDIDDILREQAAIGDALAGARRDEDQR